MESGGFVSAEVGPRAAQRLIEDPAVRRVQSKKRSRPRLTAVLPEIGLRASAGRLVPEDGTGVLIVIVDTGFDLSHPAFRDRDGGLRVEGLLDQTSGSREFTTAQLKRGWSGRARVPASTRTVMGPTSRASPAPHRSRASRGWRLRPASCWSRPTSSIPTPRSAGSSARPARDPCVINMSLGHHFGAHDGTDQEERLHRALVGPGKLIVVAAGNERTDRIHIGDWFTLDEAQVVRFDVLRQRVGEPSPC